MKKVHLFLLAFLVTFSSCKLPWASIQGATFIDYVPIGLIIYGVLALGYIALDQNANKSAYENKTKNPATKRFWFGGGGAIALIFGLAWIIFS